jgi:hypothetical protein
MTMPQPKPIKIYIFILTYIVYIWLIKVQPNQPHIYIHIRIYTYTHTYTGCLKKNDTEIQQAVVHHKHNKTILFLHRTKELLFSFSMIYFLNRNDEKWPHTRQMEIAGQSHILPPLEERNINNSQEGIKIEC